MGFNPWSTIAGFPGELYSGATSLDPNLPGANSSPFGTAPTPGTPGYGDMSNSSFTTDPNGNVVYAGGSPSMSGPDYQGMPSAPSYNPIYNPSTMNLSSQVQGDLSGINLQPLQNSVNQFEQTANAPGPSPWAALADQQQNALMTDTVNKGNQAVNGQTAGAIDQLGSTGGITSGARERVAEGGNTNAMNMAQGAARTNTENQMGIGVQNAQQKMQMQAQVPGMESMALQPQFQEAGMMANAQNSDIMNMMNSNSNANMWNQQMYGTQMGAWGAGQQANATTAAANAANSSGLFGGGGFLGLG